MIADVYDPAKGKRAGEPYIIAHAEFEQTYTLVPERAKKVQPAAKSKTGRKKS